MSTAQRIDAFRKEMERKGIAVAIVPTADSHASEYIADHFKARQWLCGFTGSAGTLVISRTEAALFTDGRYFIQAERQLAGSGVTLMRMGVAGVPTMREYVIGLLAQGDALGVDYALVSARFADDLTAWAEEAGARLCDAGDLLASIWTERPALPGGEAFPLDVTYAGRSAKEKLGDVRRAMREAGADVHVMNVLDDIAWLLNVRGSDVLYTPVVLSYLLVREEDAVWFVETAKVSAAVRAAMDEAGVTIRGYGEIEAALAEIGPDAAVMLDRSKVTARLCAALGGARVIERANPAMRMQAIKNETELDCLRRAHIKDGLAVTRLMYWLKKNAGKIPMTEMSVSEKLLSLRAEQEGFISPSFSTICAYRENAAMMHYSATPESDAAVKPRDLLLIDSGGQYYEGTTDITRTFAMGEVQPEQKKHFTAVLCAMLNLAGAKFLHGCTGISLDILTRSPIWEMGIDYRCGTGHGVGFLLSVHEGPTGFRWYRSDTRSEDTVLEPGMVTTDEPGIYIEGSHGIRTENELVCRELEKNEYGQFLGFETITCAPIDLDAVIAEQMNEKQRKQLNAYHAFVRETLSPLMADEDERAWLKEATRAI